MITLLIRPVRVVTPSPSADASKTKQIQVAFFDFEPLSEGYKKGSLLRTGIELKAKAQSLESPTPNLKPEKHTGRN